MNNNTINVTNKDYKITNTFSITSPNCGVPFTVFERNDTFMGVPPTPGCLFDVTITSVDEMGGTTSDTFRITVANNAPVFTDPYPN